jgi:hypothetical protein
MRFRCPVIGQLWHCSGWSRRKSRKQDQALGGLGVGARMRLPIWRSFLGRTICVVGTGNDMADPPGRPDTDAAMQVAINGQSFAQSPIAGVTSPVSDTALSAAIPSGQHGMLIAFADDMSPDIIASAGIGIAITGRAIGARIRPKTAKLKINLRMTLLRSMALSYHGGSLRQRTPIQTREGAFSGNLSQLPPSASHVMTPR